MEKKREKLVDGTEDAFIGKCPFQCARIWMNCSKSSVSLFIKCISLGPVNVLFESGDNLSDIS